jgi:putative ABC transport system ATP-binding protein
MAGSLHGGTESEMKTNALVQLTDVGRTYNHTTVAALGSVSLTVDRGEFTAIMGPSGSGKSTLLNLVAGLDRPSSGRVVVDGIELTGASETALARYRRSRIGFIFQFFNLLSNFTVIENVMVPAQLAGTRLGDARAQARQLLHDLDIAGIERSYPQNLSGGERQRVAIARALINKPALILADEPTGALDSHTGASVMELLDGLNQRGQTILLVTHDVNLATGHGRRVVTLRDGVVVDDARLQPRRNAEPAELVRLHAGEA